MLYPEKTITLKNGRKAILRSPRPEDAEELVQWLHKTAEETHYILRYPEEVTMTVEQEAGFIDYVVQSPNDCMILCVVDGVIAGNCHLKFYSRIKVKHRAEIAIGLLQAFWGLGIGTAMFEEMIRLGREHGITQLELEVLGDNERGLALYRKMGFRVYGERPNSIRLKDGTMITDYLMFRPL